jgi:hypothetical protein
MAALRRRRGAPPQPRDEPIPEDSEDVVDHGGDSGGGERLDKNFGFGKNFEGKYELGKEVGRGHFGHTCWAKAKKGKMKNQTVAVKIISKAKVCLLFCLVSECRDSCFVTIHNIITISDSEECRMI